MFDLRLSGHKRLKLREKNQKFTEQFLPTCR
jgi:hypothetical protein